MGEIKLLKHNQDMVDQIEEAMNSGNHKIFYSEATGLGKSYIFMYLVNKYFHNKKVLYICPKVQIWHNMMSYDEFKLIKDCVTMTCYADFNEIKEHHRGYDVIFIDEAHHLLSQIQGFNILTVADKTLEENPNAYIFGFTATPYVGKDVVCKNYFDKFVMGMDLHTAIDNGILRQINYAIAIQDTMKLSKEEQELAIRYNIDTTRNMVSTIVNEFPDVYHWVAYFPRIIDANANIRYFKKYFPEFKIFTIHSDVKNCGDIIYEYETYPGKAILVTVSMVLEGVHLKTVEGVLLYRNIRKNNTFMQVVGRLGIIEPGANPIFVDVYGSYETLIERHSEIFNNDDSLRSDMINKGHNNGYIYMSASTCNFIAFTELVYNMRNNYDVRMYRDITWTTDSDLSRKLGKAKHYVKYHKTKGKTYEEIIDCALDCQEEYRGIKWVNDKDLSIQLGKSGDYVGRYRRKGMTYEQIIDQVLDYDAFEYRGIKWVSDLDLSKKLGKGNTYVWTQRQMGNSYEDIIDNVLDSEPNEYNEYRNIIWVSNQDLSRKLGKNNGYVSAYRRKGMTYEQIIDLVLDSEPNSHNEYRDITWVNDADLSRKLGKYDEYVCYHRSQGKTYQQIIDNTLDPKIYVYRDITWKSDKELSRKLGKSSSYVRSLRIRGNTYEQIIDRVLNSKK